MRKLYAYKKENTCPVQKFIDNLNGKIKAKFMFQLSYIMDERNGFVEPYVKHFSMERYRQMYEIRVKAAERIDRNMAEELAKQTCVDWAESSALPVSKAPKASNVGKWIAVTMLVAAAAVATVFTFGATAATLIVAASIAVASTGATVGVALGVDDTVGQKNIEQWNYKENITTTFNATTGECTKVRVYQNCSEIKKNYCKRWNNPQEIRDVVQLIEPRNAE